MPTEYMTREKLLLPSSIPSIPFSSFWPLTYSSSFTPFKLISFCFLFFLLSCTSISFPSDSGHDNSSSSESWLSIPASFSNATAIIWTSFLNSWSSLNSSSFLKTSAFHSTFVCCLVFLAFDLQTVSTLAFACVLSVSKGLQVALALVQGVHEVTWL